MKRMNIHIALTERELKKEMGKFRFSKDELPHVLRVHKKLLPLLKAEAYYEEWTKKSPDHTGCSQGKCDYIVYVTLGEAPDRLQECYDEKEQLLFSYITECLSMVYLSCAYKKIIAAMEIAQKADFADLCFWEDRYEVDQLKAVVDDAKQVGLSCTPDGFMKPSKSVVLFVTLQKSAEQETLADERREEVTTTARGKRNPAFLMCSRCKHKCGMRKTD